MADAFYRIWIRAEDIPKLGVLFPASVGEVPMVGFPLMLPMGWKQSPPILTAVTETVGDLANQRLVNNDEAPSHRLDLVVESPIPIKPIITATYMGLASLPVPNTDTHHYHAVPSPIKSWDVYVDDFIGMVQGNRCHC
jgi:hypothetical protein